MKPSLSNSSVKNQAIERTKVSIGDVDRVDYKGRLILFQPDSPRRPSPERHATPIRHRPASPNKNLLADAVSHDQSQQLLQLATKERALQDLRERKRELELQISQAESDVAAAKKELAMTNNSSRVLTNNNNAKNINTRNILQKEKEMETLQHLAEGVSAIWKDVVHATIGDHATT